MSASFSVLSDFVSTRAQACGEVCLLTDTDLCIGPFDLAKQMGVERGGKEHEAAIDRILKAAKGAGKTAAFFCKSYTVFLFFKTFSGKCADSV